MSPPDHVRWHHAAHLSAAVRAALFHEALLRSSATAVATLATAVVVIRTERRLLIRAAALLHDNIVVHNVAAARHLHHGSWTVLRLALLRSNSHFAVEAAVWCDTKARTRTACEEHGDQHDRNEFKGHRTSRRK